MGPQHPAETEQSTLGKRRLPLRAASGSSNLGGLHSTYFHPAIFCRLTFFKFHRHSCKDYTLKVVKTRLLGRHFGQ